MIQFIKERASALGAQNCPNCGELDFGFGLSGKDGNGGKCVNCSESVEKYSPEKTLRFCLEVYRELAQSYDDYNDPSDTRVVINYVDDLLSPLVSSNTLPPNEKIIQFQTFLKAPSKGLLGSPTKLGGVITKENGVPGLSLEKTNLTMNKVKALSICVLAIHYMQTFKVKNEFVLDNSYSSSRTGNKTTTSKEVKSNNSGCFGLIILITSTFIALLLLIFVQ